MLSHLMEDMRVTVARDVILPHSHSPSSLADRLGMLEDTVQEVARDAISPDG